MRTPLKYMREEFKKLKWALYAVIFVFVALIFVQWGMGTDSERKRGDYIAFVGKEKITYKDYIRAYENQRENLRQFYKDRFSEEIMKGMEEMVVNTLIEEKIMKMQAEKAGLAISSEELKKEILNMPVFKKQDGSFVGFETYKNILAANQYTPKQFEVDIKESILKDRYRKLITESIFLSEDEIMEEYKKRNLTIAADYIFYPYSNMENLVRLDEKELKDYYEKIKDQFWQQERRKISYLLVDYMKIKQNLKVDEEEIKNYYDNNLNEFERKEEVRARHILIKTEERGEEKARDLANQIYERIKKGEDFEKLAKEFSEDPGSKDKGGDLGYFERGRMVPEFEEVAFSSEIGQVSEPFKSSFGFHIVQVLDKREGGTKPFEEVKPEITVKILQEKAEAEGLNKSKTLYKRILEENPKKPEDLQKYTETEPSCTFNTANYFGLNDFIQGLGRVPELNNAVFALKKGGISPPIKTNRGYVIAYLEDIKEKGISPYEDVKTEVEKKLKEEKAKKLAEEKIRAIKDKEIEEIAKILNITVSKDQTIKYLSPIPNLGNKKSLHNKLFNYSIGQQTEPLEGQKGWAIFKIKNKTEFNKEDFEAKKEEIRKTLKQNLSIQYIDILRENLKKEKQIEINPNFLKKTS